jgi:hypothetical protein
VRLTAWHCCRRPGQGLGLQDRLHPVGKPFGRVLHRRLRQRRQVCRRRADGILNPFGKQDAAGAAYLATTALRGRAEGKTRNTGIDAKASRELMDLPAASWQWRSAANCAAKKPTSTSTATSPARRLVGPVGFAVDRRRAHHQGRVR